MKYYFSKDKRGCVRCHAFSTDVAEKHLERIINKTMNLISFICKNYTYT